uniref:Uncharacterized protein n=1 Tax=Anopheles atroparvus TaxID=41427 RepID=A0AAG5DPE0_ANOAO
MLSATTCSETKSRKVSIILLRQPASWSLSKLLTTCGFDVDARIRYRSANCSIRSFRGITPDITSSDILCVDFIQPMAIRRHRYWILSSILIRVFAVRWKQKLPYSNTERIVVLYNLNMSIGCAPHQKPVTVRRKLTLLEHLRACSTICLSQRSLLSNQTPRYFTDSTLFIVSPYRVISMF